MKKDLSIFLDHILESIELIERRIKNVKYQRFIDDIDLQDMVIRRLEIIGEAVRNLPQEFRKVHPEIKWQGPADMRSYLIHGYFAVDLKIVWKTIQKNLPKFKKQIEKIIKETSK